MRTPLKKLNKGITNVVLYILIMALSYAINDYFLTAADLHLSTELWWFIEKALFILLNPHTLSPQTSPEIGRFKR